MITSQGCLQVTQESATVLAEIQAELKMLRKERVILIKELEQHRKKASAWEAREKLWEERLGISAAQIALSNKRVELWKTQYEAQKKATTPWYVHPVFVATVTAVVTGGVFYLASKIK